MKKNIIIIGLCVVFVISTGWLIYSKQTVEEAGADNQNYIESEATRHVEALDDVTSKLDETHQEVLDENRISPEQRDLLLHRFNVLGNTLIDYQQVVIQLTDDTEEDVSIGSTLHRLESYCNQVYNLQFNGDEKTLEQTEVTAWEGSSDFISRLAAVDLSEAEDENQGASTNWSRNLNEYKNATKNFNEKYHFMDYDDFWEQNNAVCSFDS